MRIEGLSTSNPDNKFTYNGKELENDLGLNWYHYGARFYDPTIGKWKQLDPVQEYYSPYVYVGNNPIIAIDPTGEDTWLVHGTASTPIECWGQPWGIIRDMWAGVFGEKTGPYNPIALGWSGDMSQDERVAAANVLADNIAAAYYKSGLKIKINIVGHSHGGNVAIMAANILKNKYRISVDNLVLLGTPQYDLQNTLEPGFKGKFVSVFSYEDYWQTHQVGSGGRFHKGAADVDVTELVPMGLRNLVRNQWFGHLFQSHKIHSNLHDNPNIADAIKSVLGDYTIGGKYHFKIK